MYRRAGACPRRLVPVLDSPHLMIKPQNWYISAGASHPPYGVDGPFPVQRTMDVNQHFGTDKYVPYAHAERHPVHHTAKFQITGAVPVEGPRSCGSISQGS